MLPKVVVRSMFGILVVLSGAHRPCSVEWVLVLPSPYNGPQAVRCNGGVSYQGHAVGPR